MYQTGGWATGGQKWGGRIQSRSKTEWMQQATKLNPKREEKCTESVIWKVEHWYRMPLQCCLQQKWSSWCGNYHFLDEYPDWKLQICGMKYSGWQGMLQMENRKFNKSLVGKIAVGQICCAANCVHVKDVQCS